MNGDRAKSSAMNADEAAEAELASEGEDEIDEEEATQKSECFSRC